MLDKKTIESRVEELLSQMILKEKIGQMCQMNGDMQFITEPGKFHVWVGASSADGLQGEFQVVR